MGAGRGREIQGSKFWISHPQKLPLRKMSTEGSVFRSLAVPWMKLNLILKAPITTAADDIHKYFFNCFRRK